MTDKKTLECLVCTKTFTEPEGEKADNYGFCECCVKSLIEKKKEKSKPIDIPKATRTCCSVSSMFGCYSKRHP